MLELLVATLAILGAAFLVAASLTPRGAVAFVLAITLLFQALIVATVGIAGLLLRTLDGHVLLAIAMGWLVAAIALVGVVGPRSTRTRARRALGRLADTLRDPAVLAGVVLVGATLIWRLVLAVRLPIVDFDGWSYHMVFVDVWVQADALVQVPQRPWTAGYPAATEMLTTWLVAFIGRDQLAGLTSLIPIPMALAAVTGLARSFGASRRMALLAGMLFGMTPALVAQAGTTYVDGSSVATVAATWWLGLRVVRGERDRSAALLLGLAGGLALGTKGTNAMLIAPVLVAAALLLLRDLLRAGEHPAPRATTVGAVAALVVPVVVFGGAWYLKNLAVYGNPLYPFSIGPFQGVTTLTDFAFTPASLEDKGKLGQLLASWLTDWHLHQYWYNVRPGGLGRAWPLVLPLAAIGVVILARRRNVAPLALVVLPAMVTLLVMPMPWYARLTLFLPAVGLPLAVVALGSVRPRPATIGGLALVAVAAISLAYTNLKPNIELQPEVQQPVSVTEYLRYVAGPAAARANVSLRADCAGFAVIPPGARVAPGGFNLLHGVVGPDLNRYLGNPLPPVTTAEELAGAMRADGASWVVTGAGGTLDDLAASAPALFVPHGTVCRGARLWELGGPGAGSGGTG